MRSEGWITNAEGISYPPAPWELAGGMHLSFWLAPRDALAASLPPGAEPVAWGGRVLVATAWVIYDPAGVLAYHELLCVVLVRWGGKLAVTILAIWVDSPVSMAGGRELWGIPKNPAEFQIGQGAPFQAAASAEGSEIASFRFRRGLRVPGRYRAGLSVAQTLDGEVKMTRMRAGGHCWLGRGEWTFSASGPLGFLAGAKPLITVELADFFLSFGI